MHQSWFPQLTKIKTLRKGYGANYAIICLRLDDRERHRQKLKGERKGERNLHRC